MTIVECHRLFRLLIDKMDAANVANFTNEEIDTILNLAQDRWVKQRYGLNNNKRLSFEESQKRMEDLKNIVAEYQTAIGQYRWLNLNYRSYEINTASLLNTPWFTVYERCIADCPGCNESIEYKTDFSTSITYQGRYLDVEPITHLELNDALKNPFVKPDKNTVLRLNEAGKTELIFTGDCTPMYYIFRYLRKPVRVSLSGNVTFELSDHTHDEIVSEAVKIALEGIESKRTPTFIPIIDNTKE